MKRSSTPLALALALALVILSLSAHADGGGGAGADASDAAAADPVVSSARAAIAKQDWATAQAGLKQALAGNPTNADYHNLYAYSIRKGAKPDMALVFSHYEQALRIDSRHRGAHEYIGEAYLAAGNLPKAREHLAALAWICFLGCEEYSDLKQAVAQYEAGQKR